MDEQYRAHLGKRIDDLGVIVLAQARRLDVLEAQVKSLQMSAPRGIPAAEPSCKEGTEK